MEEVKNTKRKRKADIVREVASGEVFFNVLWTKHRYYILLLFGLGVCYISQHYYVDQMAYAEKEMENDLKRMRMEYTIRSSELMRLSKYSSVEQELKKRNMPLVAPQRPPTQIKIN
jgi:hypothetical protein